jgi:putative peptidoglycan lipid II flippase
MFEWYFSANPGPAALGLLALGYVMAYWITLVVAWVVIARKLGGLNTARTIRSLVRMSVAGLLMLLAMRGIQLVIIDHLPGGARIAAIIDIILVGAIGAAVYLWAASRMRISEVNDVIAIIRRRISR